MIVREQFDNGLRLFTESMPEVRSVSFGAWLTRGSRHESATARSGVAHFVEHMLFKGTARRSARDIAQEIDSIGGQLDAFTAKECASYYVKVIDEHLPRAVDVLADLLRNPAFAAKDIEKEKKVVLEEIKMVEDTPDDLVYELFTQRFWSGHPLGRPILGVPATVAAFDAANLREYFGGVYTAGNLVIAVAGNVDHAALRDLVGEAFGGIPANRGQVDTSAPSAQPGLQVRDKALEQCHICLGVGGYPQQHDDRYVCYVLNDVLGGTMSSRLFQNIRENRGLAYAVSSGLVSYKDGGAFTIYAGCDRRRRGRGGRSHRGGVAGAAGTRRLKRPSWRGPRIISRAASCSISRVRRAGCRIWPGRRCTSGRQFHDRRHLERRRERDGRRHHAGRTRPVSARERCRHGARAGRGAGSACRAACTGLRLARGSGAERRCHRGRRADAGWRRSSGLG